MIAEPLVRVGCAVCGDTAHDVVCAAHEVEAHLAYLRRFHRRRLRPGAPPAALGDRAEFTQDYATNIVACRGCRLVFRNPRPPAASITSAYALDRYGHQRLAAMFQPQVALYRPKARLLLRWLAPGARVVEVGSFVGGFLAACREQGWDALGVDPGEEVDSFCAERGLPVHRGTLAELVRRGAAGMEPGSVDCVAIWNTFDQLPDPEPTLAAARRLLRPGGILALRVPNGECFRLAACCMRRLPSPWAGWLRAGMAWNNLLAFPYLHGYSVRTLDWLLAWQEMERLRAVPDTLCRVSDAETKRWAACEERTLKLLARLAARAEGLRRGSSLALAPWIDLYYRRI